MFILYPFVFFQVFAIGSFGVSTSDLFILVLNLIVLFKFFVSNEPLKIPKTSIHIYLFILFFFALLSGLTPLVNADGENLIQFLKTFSHFFYLYLFLFLFLSYEIDEKIIFTAIKIYLFLSIFINLYGIYQLIARAFDLPYGWVELSNVSLLSRVEGENMGDYKQLALKFKDFYRATSIFPEPSVFVQFNLLSLIFLSIPYISKAKLIFKSRLLLNIIFLLVLINLFITFSLTAVLGLVFIIFLSFFLETKELFKKYLIIFSISFFVLLVADFYVNEVLGVSLLNMIFDRVIGVILYVIDPDFLVEGESFLWRLEVVIESFYVWLKSPVFGVGLGLFAKNSDIATFSDNSFLSILSEAGPIAALAFLGLFVSIFYHSIRIRKSDKYNLTETQKTLLVILPYLMIILFEVNYLTANGWLGVTFIVPFFIVFTTLNNIFASNNEFYLVKFSENSILEKLDLGLNNYLKKYN